ncbi:MAG: phage portal protein [Bacteroidota bacterium]
MGLLSSWNRIKAVIKEGNEYFYQVWSSGTQYSQSKKLQLILENPAALFLILMLCDLYSMGEYKLYREGSEEPEDSHDLLDFLNDPNPMQTKEQFAWDYMFWRKLGCANLYLDSKILKGSDNMGYWLSGDCIEWPDWFDRNKNTLFVSRASVRELMQKQLVYKTDSQTLPFRYENLKQFHDISNGIKGWFTSPSRVDAIYKIINNSDAALDSKNINIRFSGKYIVAGKHDAKDINSLPMGEGEKKDIETKMLGKRSVHAMKSMVDIKRFVERSDVMKNIDESYLDDAMKIGQMFKVPQDVIGNLTKGSTYENQEMARASLASYCLQPDSEDFCQGILDHFGITGYTLKYSFDHLPFVQAFEKDRSEVKKNLAKAFLDMVNAGADQQQTADYLGLDIDSFGPRNESQTTTEETKIRKLA